MEIKTVGQLKCFLDESGLSPERLSLILRVSNMTIRRLLKDEPTAMIPEKYEPHFAMLALHLKERQTQL